MNQIFTGSTNAFTDAVTTSSVVRFSTSVLKEILHDHKPDYTNEGSFWRFTPSRGGVPKYIDRFMQKGCTDMESVGSITIVEPDSPSLMRARHCSFRSLGRSTAIILPYWLTIANGRNTTAEIEQNVGDTVIAGRLEELKEVY